MPNDRPVYEERWFLGQSGPIVGKPTGAIRLPAEDQFAMPLQRGDKVVNKLTGHAGIVLWCGAPGSYYLGRRQFKEVGYIADVQWLWPDRSRQTDVLVRDLRLVNEEAAHTETNR